MRYAQLLILSAALIQAQTTKVNDSCDLAMFGAKSTKEFLQFDADLRAALRKPDPSAVAVLADPALRVSASNGSSYTIASPDTIRANFNSIFTKKTRDAVESQQIESLFCRGDEGIMYGENGQVWVAPGDTGWTIKTVNQDLDSAAELESYKLEYVCHTPKLRILVDSSNSTPRYRVWNQDRSVLDKPNLELIGTVRMEGSGPCAYPLWTFHNGKITYEVAGAIGCYDSRKPPPEDATGDLTVLDHDKPISREWCR